MFEGEDIFAIIAEDLEAELSSRMRRNEMSPLDDEEADDFFVSGLLQDTYASRLEQAKENNRLLIERYGARRGAQLPVKIVKEEDYGAEIA